METETKDTKRSIKFKDADGNQFIVEIEFRFSNGFKELSLCGNYGGGCGQCYDSINPKNEPQERLLAIWKTYHLNGMSSGTPEQNELLDKYRNHVIPEYPRLCQEWLKEYDQQCLYLKIYNKYTVEHPETGEPFIYGHSWYHLPLPDDIDYQIDSVIDDINEIEEEERGDELIVHPDKQEDESYLADYPDPVIALALHLELTMIEIEEVRDDGSNRYSYAGTDYLVAEYDDLVTIAEEYLTQDDYIWKQAVEAGSTTKGLQEWVEEVVEIDGVGHILNSWDGSEDEQEVNGTDYTIVQN